MGRRADLPSGARKDGYVLRNQQWLFAEIPVLDENGKMHDSLVFGAEINPHDGDKLSN